MCTSACVALSVILGAGITPAQIRLDLYCMDAARSEPRFEPYSNVEKNSREVIRSSSDPGSGHGSVGGTVLERYVASCSCS